MQLYTIIISVGKFSAYQLKIGQIHKYVDIFQYIH